jgi:hypothetical protein
VETAGETSYETCPFPGTFWWACSSSATQEPNAEADLIAHCARTVAVGALDESATVGVAELVRNRVRRESALDRLRRTDVAQLVKLQALASSPALPNDAERVAARVVHRKRGMGVIAEPDHGPVSNSAGTSGQSDFSRRQQPAASRRQPDHHADQITLAHTF